jgi:hypothetical protein
VLTCVTTNKTKRFATGLGEIDYHRIKPTLFFGYALEQGIPRARAEKAALDLLYLELRSGRRRPLDEWNWDELDLELLQSWLPRYPSTVAATLAADEGALATSRTRSGAGVALDESGYSEVDC